MVFDAAEIGESAFGYNIPNTQIVAALTDALGASFIATDGVTAIEPVGGAMRLSLVDGRRLDAKLVVGADGRQSLCRQAAGIQNSRMALRSNRDRLQFRSQPAP